ncbi:MAG: DUF5668 domain-containing protein [Syntrophomonadaceae bacterium]|nr:DUF5668 domain-containing protein [Syntrophomonadaceae bacterium]
MRHWRVGTLTMGLLLVAAGAGLLLDRFYHLAVVDFSLKWWPLLFIFLGAEVLWQNQIKRDENSKIRYDIFSIVIILFIVFSGLGLQALSQTGLIERARTSILSQMFAFENSAEIPLEPGIQKIVLTTKGNPVVIRTTPGSSIVVNSSLQVRAQSQHEAAAAADQSNRLSGQQIADVEYITLQANRGSEQIINCSYTLIIPQQVDIEIDAGDSSLDINISSLQHNWQINGSGLCTMQLPGRANATIDAWLNRESSPQGNLTWNKSEPDHEVSEPNDNPATVGPSMVHAQSKLGNGSNQINILGMQELTINYLP